MSEETRKTIALINRGELLPLNDSAEVTDDEFGLQTRYDNKTSILADTVCEIVDKVLQLICYLAVAILGVMHVGFLTKVKPITYASAEVAKVFTAEKKVKAEPAATQKELKALGMTIDERIAQLAAKVEQLEAEQTIQIIEVTPDINAYSDIRLTKDERELLEWIVALETTRQPQIGKRAVVETIFNRNQRGWGKTIYDVLTAKGQFEAYDYYCQWLRGEFEIWAVPTQADREAIDFVLKHGRTVLPEDYVYFATYKANGRDFIQIGNHYFSRG